MPYICWQYRRAENIRKCYFQWRFFCHWPRNLSLLLPSSLGIFQLIWCENTDDYACRHGDPMREYLSFFSPVHCLKQHKRNSRLLEVEKTTTTTATTTKKKPKQNHFRSEVPKWTTLTFQNQFCSALFWCCAIIQPMLESEK